MVIKKMILLFIMFCFIGCDMFTTDDKRLVGNILLINPHNQDINGYRMVIYEDDVNSNVLEQDVLNVYGDDTILLAKCKNENGDFIYYKINHIKGKKLINALGIQLKEYTAIKESIKIKYSFIDE